MKKRKLKNKEYRDLERELKIVARKLKSKKCYKDCYLLQRDFVTHNGCLACPCCKNSPFCTKGDKYVYLRNKRARRELWKMCPF